MRRITDEIKAQRRKELDELFYREYERFAYRITLLCKTESRREVDAYVKETMEKLKKRVLKIQ